MAGYTVTVTTEDGTCIAKMKARSVEFSSGLDIHRSTDGDVELRRRDAARLLVADVEPEK